VRGADGREGARRLRERAEKAGQSREHVDACEDAHEDAQRGEALGWCDRLEHVGDAYCEGLHGAFLATPQLAWVRCDFGVRSPRTNQSSES
jgi:hypothetical protein